MGTREKVRGLMEKNITPVIYFLLMVVTIVVADLLFFRDRFLARLLANIGIVLVYAAFYLSFLK